MSAFGTLFGDIELLGKDGQKVPASSLDGTDVVGLYFSAHWCPPCRGFTPMLVKTYNKLKADGKNFKVVFVSGDKDTGSFENYFGEMPWLALPFEANKVNKALNKKFKVNGIPSLILLNNKGELIRDDGRNAVSNDSEGKKFPWTPPTIAEMLGTTFVKKDDSIITAESLDGKVVGLYFSAHWCGPCRSFTPQLAELYKKLTDAGKPFEIIFISSDRDEASFDEYRHEMPWVALPFVKRENKEELSSRFGVSGIPSLIILDGIKTGKLINDAARESVSSDPEGADFPWYPKPLNDLCEGADGINDNPALVALLKGAEDAADAKAALESIANSEFAKAKQAGEMYADMRFFFAMTDGGPVMKQLKKLTKVEEPALLLLDIPDDGGFYTKKIEGKLSAETIQSFMKNYKDGSLERKQLQ
jgi:nucleoredoxin